MPKNEYLHKEYELCFEQLRFYDNRHFNILKYSFTLTSAVSTAQFAVYKILQSPTQDFYICQAFLSVVVFIATLLLYLSLLQNRMYFVYVAKQINAIRGFLMETEAENFKNNQLYTSTNFSALKLSSVHTFQLIGAAFISALFAGVSAYSVYPALGNKPCFTTAFFTFLAVAVAEIWGGVKYLSDNGKKQADEAIHGKKITGQKPESGKGGSFSRPPHTT